MFPGKESPWAVLGLESETATVRDVKRSYAKLLKQHRPDTDPEGFRRLHDAYQTVLQELEIRDHPGGSPAFGTAATPASSPEPLLPLHEAAGPATPSPPEIELPVPFLTAMEKLRRAADPGEIPDALNQLRLVCGQDNALWQEWAKALSTMLDTGGAVAGLATAVPATDVLSALRAGAGGVAARILDVWHSEKLHASMVAVGKALTAKGAFKEFDHPGTGFFALRLAFNLAVAQPGGANLLLDAAFSWLPPELRSQAMPPVENRLSIGRIFWHVPPTWQGFWENTMDDIDAGRTPDWTSPEARRAINDLLRITPADWPGWGFLKSQLKELQWQGIVDHFNSRPLSRRAWTTPPERTWINTSPADLPGAPFVSRHPLQRSLAEDDAWSIPEAEPVPVRPKSSTASPLAWTSMPTPTGAEHAVEKERREAATSGFRKVLYHYYRIPRSVRILLLCILTWALVFGIASLIRFLP